MTSFPANLKERFLSLAQTFSANDPQMDFCWNEISENYSGKKRHYHALSHLENLFEELEALRTLVHNWDAVAFAVFYHDLVYDAKKQDNEEQSALLAEKRLTALSVPEAIISLCKEIILATKSHSVSANSDVNLFTDADLSILGKPWEQYEIYYKQIREEYSVYPDLLYKPGRRKVLKHFLAMERIFKTDVFREKYEKQARWNLERELDVIS